MNDEFDVIDIDEENVSIEDVMDGSGHTIATIIVSLLGGAVLGAGSKFLYDRFNNDEKKLKRKEKKLEKLKRDAQKLGIDLNGIPEVEIPTDEEIEIETEVEETEAEEIKKPKKGGKKK